MIETFDSTKNPLSDLLRSIDDGKIQLPDFQRGWVWDDERIKSLLASIAVSYPIGAIMLLETGNPDVKFKPRPVHGAKGGVAPESFILDGQQRMTTLYQTLFSKNIVDTKDYKQKDIKRWYYFDIKKALVPDSDIVDAIVSISEKKTLATNFGRDIYFDLRTSEDEYENLAFPVNEILNSTDWFNNYMQYWKYDQEKIKIFQKFQDSVLKRFDSYQVPVIKMLKHNPKDAVCQVFEKVNTGGVSLSVFELLTATFAADDYNLRDDWHLRKSKFQDHEVIKKLGTNELLQAISLLSTIERKENQIKQGVSDDNLSAISCKKKDVLKIDLTTYQKWVDLASEGFIEASKFLMKHKVFKSRDLPYSTQLVPLSVIITRLGKEFENDGIKKKIIRWYWNGILGELYGGANETRFAKDATEVIDWINGGEEPSTIKDAFFSEDRLWTLRTRNSAAYKGIFILLMQSGALDFISGDPIEWTNYYDEAIDIHHIYPQKWCIDNGVGPSIYNSIINKTPLTARTNRMIGGKSPSLYLEAILRKNDSNDDRLSTILDSHYIDIEYLQQDDFQGFLDSRKEYLISLIENTMGKSIQRNKNIEE